MSETSDYDKIYEVDKNIKVNSVMQLIDINGSKINFQSDCLVKSSIPTSKIMVAIVNQDELDNGNINFEPMDETGKYARRVSFQENVKKNHFICIKKHPSEQEDDIDCSIVIRMKELPPKAPQAPPKKIAKPPNNPNTPKNIPKNIPPPKERDDSIKNENIELKKQLEELRKKQEYKNKKDIENERDFDEDLPSPKYRMMPPQENEANSYYKISMICLVLFTLIVFYKFVRK